MNKYITYLEKYAFFGALTKGVSGVASGAGYLAKSLGKGLGTSAQYATGGAYWDYAYISINTRTREVTMLREPEIKTATTFVKYVLEQYGLVYDKNVDSYKLPERIA